MMRKEKESNFQEWTGIDFAISTGQLETGQGGKGMLRSHLWCPDDLPRVWDRIELNRWMFSYLLYFA